MTKIYGNIKERILQLADYKEVNKSTFFNKTGLKYSNFTGKNKNSDIQSRALAEILAIYNDVNPIWLITGEGEMTLSEEKAIEDKGQEISLFGLNDRVTALEENLSEKAVESNSDPNILNALNQINESLKIINKTLIDNAKELD